MRSPFRYFSSSPEIIRLIVMMSVARGNPITFDDQKRKLELILEVADEVWGSS